MSTAIEKDLQEVINQHLPQQTSDALRRRLEQADADARVVVRLTEGNATLTAQVKALELKLRERDEKLVQAGDLSAREAAVAESERNLKVRILEVRLEEANRRADAVSEFTRGLVRNTEFRSGLSRTVPVARSYAGGGDYIEHHTESENRSAVAE